MSDRKCFVYVNHSRYKGRLITKVGRSFCPEKRIGQFNNGLKHRYRNKYLDERVSFRQFFCMAPLSVSECKALELTFLRNNRSRTLHQFGLEVFSFSPEAAALELCRLAGQQ